MIEFTHEPAVAELGRRVRAFVRGTVIGVEQRLGRDELDDEKRADLQAAAREAGVFAPHAPVAYGGLGLDVRAWTLVMEEAGYSPLGPQALNCAAPDEGNMRLLEVVADDAQRERWLRPLCEGRIRSAFAMTEPHPGAGSDPAMLQTAARRIPGGWRIDGHKRYVTGIDGAALVICMARTDETIDRDRGATMFLVAGDAPGLRRVRRIPTIDHVTPGGHWEIAFEGCEVADEDVLGESGRGYALAQVRLGPARLTHCIRWLGLARRALDLALDRAEERELFGRPLIDHGMAQQLIADSVVDIEAARQLNRLAAWAIDTGQPARHETGVAKVFVAEAVHRIIDRAIQICGGDGVSHDLPLARYLDEVRPFRIYDGPSEVHRMAIARRAVRRRSVERS